MKNKYIVLLAAAVAALTTLFLLPIRAHGEPPTPEPVVLTVYVEKPALNASQVLWLARLMQCESGLKASAVNPSDLDGTPSLGVLQFKIGTFTHYKAKYGIEGDIMDAVPQVAIVTEWLLRPGEVDWTRQFPACVRKLGLPPVTAVDLIKGAPEGGGDGPTNTTTSR